MTTHRNNKQHLKTTIIHQNVYIWQNTLRLNMVIIIHNTRHNASSRKRNSTCFISSCVFVVSMCTVLYYVGTLCIASPYTSFHDFHDTGYTEKLTYHAMLGSVCVDYCYSVPTSTYIYIYTAFCCEILSVQCIKILCDFNPTHTATFQILITLHVRPLVKVVMLNDSE